MLAPEKGLKRNYGYPCRFEMTIPEGPVFRWYLGDEMIVSASREGVSVTSSRLVHKRAGLLSLLKLANLALEVHEKLDNLDSWDSVDPIKEFVKQHKGA